MKNGPIAEFVSASRILVENARDIPEVATILTRFGYDQASLEAGAALLDQIDALILTQSKEYGEAFEATKNLSENWEAADKVYIQSLKVARIAFGEDAMASASLKLYGPRKRSIVGWLSQAIAFYGTLVADSNMIAKMEKYGFGIDKLTAEKQLVDAIHVAMKVQTKETGQAQSATVARDRKLEELDKWVSDLRAICKVAFHDTPQDLEKLGIEVLNAPRAKKKTPAALASK